MSDFFLRDAGSFSDDPDASPKWKPISDQRPAKRQRDKWMYYSSPSSTNPSIMCTEFIIADFIPIAI